MAMMEPRDSILVLKGTIKILHTKHSLVLSEHDIGIWLMWDSQEEYEILHRQCMGKNFYLAWYLSEQELIATIKWRQLSEDEIKKLAFLEVQKRLEEDMKRITERRMAELRKEDWDLTKIGLPSLREVSDHEAYAVAFSQLSKRGK